MNRADIRSLDIGMLRTFEALMRERSVSRAAARLFLSQSAVSATLQRLREVFDDPLFKRTGHGVEPTPRALALASQVQQVLQDIAALLERDRPFDPASSERVFRITGSDFASGNVLVPLAQRLLAMGSRVRLVWEPPGTGSLQHKLAQGDLDLAVVARLHPPEDLEHEVLYEDHYVHVLRRDHPRAQEPLTRESFCAMPQVFLGYGTSTFDDLIDQTLAQTGHQRLAQVAVSSFSQILHLLLHGDHAAVIGHRIAQQHADALCIRPLPFEFPRYRALVCWDARARHDPGIAWLREQVLGVLGATAVQPKRAGA